MEASEFKTKEAVLKKAQEAIGIPLQQIDKTGRLSTGKGAVGTVIEESWFGYTPNSESEPDFPEAGVELKATPYIRTNSGIRAKERLVCNIINYMTEYQKTFKTSAFWHKCETMLIMSYEHKKDVPKGDFTIDKAILFSFPMEDLVIIEQDWKKIISKVKEGQAHLITEGDTLYLAACTKGANASSVRQQPFSDIPAKQRAYSLKSSYMTRILNRYVFGSEEDERIIKDWHELEHKSFEECMIERLSAYYGMTQAMLKDKLQVESAAKNLNEVLLSKMLGVEGKIAYTEEFQNASIVPKTIRVQKSGHIKESMSFPTFKFTEIIKEDWDSSEFRNYLEPTKFLFVIFQENDDGEYVFEKVMFWNIPAEDLEEVRRVWERTVQVIKEGVQLRFDGRVMRNNLPKQSESRVAHVRPHARDMEDTYPLPDGRTMPKQCFWLNSSYIETVISGNNEHKTVYYDFSPSVSMVAEPKAEYGTKREIPFVPCGAYVKHIVLGIGQVNEIILSFDKHPWVEYPYLVGKREEFSVNPDGKTVYHERFGKGEVVQYRIAFKDSELHFAPEDFLKGELSLCTLPETE